MDLTQPLRGRLTDGDVPPQIFALVGATVLVKDRILEIPERAGAASRSVRSTKDQAVTTALQVAHEARDRAVALPRELAAGAQRGLDQALLTPHGLRGEIGERVIDLREGAAHQYSSLAASGERAVSEWNAERRLNQRAERVTRSVTPAAAKAAVSARDGARRAAESPTAQRLGRAGRRVRASAKQAWTEYLGALDEAGVQRWGGTEAPPATGPIDS